jgi:molybdopterin molybdotransferase
MEYAEMMDDYRKSPGLTHFLKGVYNGSSVFLPKGQESYKLNSFARANCIVEIPEDRSEVKKGDKVEIHRIF